MVTTYNFTTGPTILPDVGTLSYNGCVFSPLFTTQVSGKHVRDNANRTVKYMEYTIKVDGYVTLPTGSASIASTMANLRKLLEAQGGALVYKGRGFDISVNNGADLDVAWGPAPEVLEFQSLGGGLSAKIVWQCKVTINEQKSSDATRRGFISFGEMLQFNYESTVSYGEDGFSKLNVRGTIEVPLTRTPSQKTRTLKHTADDLRSEIDSRIMGGIDLNKFRVVERSFHLSRDKRTLEWSISTEELAYQQMPPDCTVARGSYTVRPAKVGYGLVRWLCSLRCTYTVRADRPRRTAWLAFLAMLRLRMRADLIPVIPTAPGSKEEAESSGFADLAQSLKEASDAKKRKRLLLEFTVEEGLYLDSKIVSFSATWTLITRFANILRDSTMWYKVGEKNKKGESLWAISMKDVQGSKSWLENGVDAGADIIVDFGM